jgi:hypothetical protein
MVLTLLNLVRLGKESNAFSAEVASVMAELLSKTILIQDVVVK